MYAESLSHLVTQQKLGLLHAPLMFLSDCDVRTNEYYDYTQEWICLLLMEYCMYVRSYSWLCVYLRFAKSLKSEFENSQMGLSMKRR